MNLSRDVVRDLLTLYLAGDASDDTRALVEEHLARDPALRAEADAASPGRLRLPAAPAPAGSVTAEKRALDKARELVKTRTATLVLAVLFTVLPLTVAFSGSRITFLLVRDTPVIAAACWFTAAVMWIWHVRVRRRLGVSGL